MKKSGKTLMVDISLIRTGPEEIAFIVIQNSLITEDLIRFSHIFKVARTIDLPRSRKFLRVIAVAVALTE
jgi:hypothetical protein